MSEHTFKYHLKKTVQIALPVCVSQFGHIMVGVADTAMVGRLGTPEQAAVALANSLFFLVLVFAIGLSMGVTPPTAAAHAQGDKKMLSLLHKNSFAINLAISVGLFVLFYFASPLFNYMNQPQDVTLQAIPYFNVVMLSLIPLSIFFSLKQFTEAMSDTRMAMVVTLVANALNVLLNYILIFGKMGFTPMGLMGACWATFISRVAMALFMFLYVFYSRKYKEYWNDFLKPQLHTHIIKKILKVGIPSGMQWVFEVGAFSLAAVMAGWLGKSHQAAHQVALSIAAITYMVASGISAAVTVRVGNYFGLNDTKGIKMAAHTAYIVTLAFMSFSALMFVLLRTVLPHFFSIDEEVISIVSGLLIIAAFFQLFDGTQVVGLGVLRGMSDTIVATVVTLVAYWAIAVPLSYWLAFSKGQGIYGIWWGLSTGLVLVAFLVYWRFYHLLKKRATQEIL